jgi:hypothetical protein
MTPNEISIAESLNQVVFPIASSVKRFAENMMWRATNNPELPLTASQSRYLKQVAWKFRKQLPESIVRLGLKPDDERNEA